MDWIIGTRLSTFTKITLKVYLEEYLSTWIHVWIFKYMKSFFAFTWVHFTRYFNNTAYRYTSRKFVQRNFTVSANCVNSTAKMREPEYICLVKSRKLIFLVFSFRSHSCVCHTPVSCSSRSSCPWALLREWWFSRSEEIGHRQDHASVIYGREIYLV